MGFMGGDDRKVVHEVLWLFCVQSYWNLPENKDKWFMKCFAYFVYKAIEPPQN
jgi:hypothetical protein